MDKLKRFCIIICLLFTAATLGSCLVPSGGGGNGAQDVDAGLIYGPSTTTRIVSGEAAGLNLLGLVGRIGELCGKRPELASDGYAPEKHEIVVGETTRAITDAAKAALDNAVSSSDIPEDELKWYLHYMIYSDGDSVAIVWSDDLVVEEAVEYFMNEYVKSESLKLDAGHSKLVSVNKIDKMREDEAKAREEKYAEIAEALGQDMADALRNHMSIYDECFYLWLADLYDPGEYDEDGNPLGGGFYYSNSARETQGYLIDIESTGQALGFLSSSGMLTNFKTQIPEKMQKEMVAFALSLQDPEDGYFYHPQWGKNISIGRQSRDVGWATNQVLARFGYKPYWNAPNGVEGIYGEPGASRTASLRSESVVEAVSSVTAVASNLDKWPERLRSLEAWENYLKGYESEIHTKSYSIGHTVAEQCGQIKNRDAEAAEDGEPMGYAALTIQYFDKWQQETQQALIEKGEAPNGLWEETVSYNSLNGLMKISAIYVNLADYFNYAEEALASSAEIILLEDSDINGKEATGSVDVYNPWIAISRIFSIMNKSGDSAAVGSLRERLRAMATDMIRVTTKKTVKFRKDDGSYGYTWDYSPAKSQGAPAAVPNTVEGDVNGGTIALTGVTVNMLTALGISGLTIYAPSDLEIFLDRVSGLTHVVKAPIATEESGPVDFEDSDVGPDLPIRVSTGLTSGTAEIVDGGFESDRALMMVTVPDKGDSISVKTGLSANSDSCYTVEWDMRFSNVNVGAKTAMQVSLGGMYILTLGVGTDGVLSFGDTSSQGTAPITNNYTGSFNALEWHHVRVEHYRTVEGGPITLLYVDGELLGTSDNYFGKEKGGDLPTAKLDTVKYYALWGVDYSVTLDNVNAESGDAVLDEEFIPKPQEPFDGYIDLDNADLGTPNIAGLSVKPNPEQGNSIEVVNDPLDGDNQALKLVAKPSSTAGNWVYVNAPDEASGDGVYAFETDVYIAAMNKNSVSVQVYIYSGAKTVFAVDMTVLKQSDGVTLTFDEKVSDNSKNEVFLRVDELISSYFTLRVEYDPTGAVGRVTVTTDENEYSATTDAYYQEDTKSGEFSRAAFYTTFGTDAEIYLDNMVTER